MYSFRSVPKVTEEIKDSWIADCVLKNAFCMAIIYDNIDDDYYPIIIDDMEDYIMTMDSFSKEEIHQVWRVKENELITDWPVE